METQIKETLEKLTLKTDVVKEIEATTEKHYNLNKKFLVFRNGKEFFISIKQVDVIGQVIKSHIRLDIDTDLPKNEKPLTKKEFKILELEEKLTEAKKNNVKWAIFQYKHDLMKLRGW